MVSHQHDREPRGAMASCDPCRHLFANFFTDGLCHSASVHDLAGHCIVVSYREVWAGERCRGDVIAEISSAVKNLLKDTEGEGER